MILYSVNYRGPLTNDEWSIVTIHKTYEGAEKAMNTYIQNYGDRICECDYIICEIDTDIDSDTVYDYNKVDSYND